MWGRFRVGLIGGTFDMHTCARYYNERFYVREIASTERNVNQNQGIINTACVHGSDATLEHSLVSSSTRLSQASKWA